jgi:polypeptide N-acetylgalactosaminyltransferase
VLGRQAVDTTSAPVRSGAATKPATISSPDVSIVVVSHNERENVVPTLMNLAETTAGVSASLTVVDDASTDDSASLVENRLENVQLVRSASRLGISRARNLGANSTNSSIIVFSDAHVVPEEGWLEELCQQLEQPGVGAVAPAVCQIGENTTDYGYGFTWRSADLTMKWLMRKPPRPTAVPFLCGCFIAVRRDVFEECGGFDEGLMLWGSEDAELSLRLWRRGWECRVVPESRVAHLFRKRFPYEINWEPIVHNVLRTATVHLNERGLSSVVDHYRQNSHFPRSCARLAASDVWLRREDVEAVSCVRTSSILKRFKIDAVA